MDSSEMLEKLLARPHFLYLSAGTKIETPWWARLAATVPLDRDGYWHFLASSLIIAPRLHKSKNK